MNKQYNSIQVIIADFFFFFSSLRGAHAIKAALTASYHPECQDSRVQAPEASSAYPVADITRSILPPFGDYRYLRDPRPTV